MNSRRNVQHYLLLMRAVLRRPRNIFGGRLEGYLDFWGSGLSYSDGRRFTMNARQLDMP